MEGSWRGLHHLVNNTETDEMLKIKVFNVSKGALRKNLKKYEGTAWDQSPVFKKIYEEEYGMFGGRALWMLAWRLLLRPKPHGRQDAGQPFGDRCFSPLSFYRRCSSVGHEHGVLAGVERSS